MDILPYLKYIAIFSFVGIVLSIFFFFKIQEAFVTQEDVVNIDLIVALMTILSESICPSTLFAAQTIVDKSTWVPLKDTDYGDVTYKTVEKPSFDACCAECALDTNCMGIVYKSKKYCQLKKSMDSPLLKEAALSSPFKGMPTDPDPANASRTYGTSAKRPEMILSGSAEEKRKKALASIEKDAKGPLFTCPVDPDPYRIPGNIEQRIKTSVAYLEPLVTKALKNIVDALNCSPDVMKNMADDKTKSDGAKNQSKLSALQGKPIDGFFDFDPETAELCSREHDAIQDRQAEEAAKRASLHSSHSSHSKGKCVRQDKLTDEDKARILRMRVASLKSVMNNQELVKSLMTIKSTYTELAVIKTKALNGELQPTCMSAPADGSISFTGTSNSQETKQQGVKLQELGKTLGSSKSPEDRMMAPIFGMIGLLRSM